MMATDVDSVEVKSEATYASIAKLFENFGVHTTPASIARSYTRWANANRGRIDKETDRLGLPSALNHELGTLFLPDVIREEVGPAIKTSIMCGESDVVTVGKTTEAKLAAVQSAVQIATESLQEAPGGQANLGYVRLLYDSAMHAGGNSLLNTCEGWVHTVRVTNDYFVDRAAREIGRAFSLRGVRALIEAADADDVQPIFDEFRVFGRDLLCTCFCAGSITYRQCSKVYKAHSLAFVDGKINLENVARGVHAGVARHMAFFFDRAAHDRKAHLLALDPHRMSWISSLYGTDMSPHRAAIAEAMASI